MTTATQLCACGVREALQRCAACPLSAATLPVGRFIPEQRQAPVYVTSRWRKGPTTFGPLGRVLTTLLLLLPVPALLLTLAIGIGIAGMVAYCGVLLPMALREVWKPARFPV